MAMDTQVDPYSAKDFVKATAKPGTIGDMWDCSAELSQKRADRNGKDPLKEKFYEDYSKKHGGRKHHAQEREQLKEKLKNSPIEVTFNDE